MTRKSNRRKRKSVGSESQGNQSEYESKLDGFECDYRLHDIVHVKYCSEPSKVQKWIDVLSNEYPKNESVIQSLHGGGKGGKQVKLITGECAGTIIELFYDTGMIVIKGKSPNFLRWATSTFSVIKTKVENGSNPCQDTLVKNIACSKSETVGDSETLSHSPCVQTSKNHGDAIENAGNKLEGLTLHETVSAKTVCDNQSENSETVCDKISDQSENSETVCDKISDQSENSETVCDKISDQSENSKTVCDKISDQSENSETVCDKISGEVDVNSEDVKNSVSPLTPVKTMSLTQSLSFDIKKLKHSLVQIESAIACLPEIKEVVLNQNTKLQESIEDLSTEKQNCDNIINKLKKSNTDLNVKNDNLHKEIDILKNQLSEARCNALQLENDKLKQSKEMQDRIRQSNDDLKNQKEYCKSLQLECLNMKKMCAERGEVIENQSTMLKECNERCKTLIDENKTLKVLIEDLQEKHSGIESKKVEERSENGSTKVAKKITAERNQESSQSKQLNSENNHDRNVRFVKGESDILSMFNVKKSFRYASRAHTIPEVAYQMSKAEITVGRDHEILDNLYNCKSGKEAKELAKDLPYSRLWENQKRDEMKKVVRQVVLQDQETREALKETGVKILKHNVADSFWGTGPYGNGRNEYGIILMELRRETFGLESVDVPTGSRYHDNRDNRFRYNRFRGNRDNRFRQNNVNRGYNYRYNQNFTRGPRYYQPYNQWY